MKFPIKTTVALLVLGSGGAVGYPMLTAWWKARNKPHFRQAEVVRGEIISVINSTGTVQPVLRVQVGTFVSGPIVELLADHNQPVKENELLARIDPRIYKALMARDEATLATRKAEVARSKALLEQAENDEKRAIALRKENPDYISDMEMDQFKYSCIAQRAQLELAEASVLQAEAGLQNSKANLDYTEIRSPCDGIVIDRKIDEGQTLAAQFQTPELFIVAPDMEKMMHVFASVDEADIGLIREAHRRKQKVHFTVDAYPDDLFEGTINQIRVNPTTTLNVVTYPVVVAAANPEMKLLPGMTAQISFQIDRRQRVVKIPNAALRYYPRPEHVRPKDRKLLEGAARDEEDEEEENASTERLSVTEAVLANRKRNRRHVWVTEGDYLRAVEIVVGMSDYKYTEMVSGEPKEGQKLVTGIGPQKP